MAQKATRHVERLTFTVVEGAELRVAPGRGGAPELVWRAGLGPRFRAVGPRLAVHWLGPDGTPRGEQPVQAKGASGMARFAPADPSPGRWVAETRLDGERVDRRGVVLPAALD